MKVKLIKTWMMIAIISVLAACGGSDSSQMPTDSDQSAAVVDEDDLLVRLSALLIPNPQSDFEKEQNALVNYAIDQKLNVRKLKSGILYQITAEGDDVHPDLNDRLTAHYRGRLLNGKEFDSSYSRSQPLQFTLAQMIPAWREVVPMIGAGGKLTLLTPSYLAYGEKGFSDLIPPNAPLRFDVELLQVQSQ